MISNYLYLNFSKLNVSINFQDMFATIIASGRPEPVIRSTDFSLEEDEQIMCFISEDRWADQPCQRKVVREALYERVLERRSTRRYAEVIRRAAQLGCEKYRDKALEAFSALAARSGESEAASHERFKHAQFLLCRYFQKQRAAWVPSPARKRKKNPEVEDAIALKQFLEISFGQNTDNEGKFGSGLVGIILVVYNFVDLLRNLSACVEEIYHIRLFL